jgi:gliding motility-associated-like protein
MEFPKFIAFLSVLWFLATSAFAQCDSLFLGDDQTLCGGQTLLLDAGEGALTYLWNNGSTSQTIYVNEPGQYWCTVQIVDSNNMVINGNFNSGYTGFQSDYVHNPVSVYAEGTFAVTTSPALVHPNFAGCTDHTTGTGKMMVVNGAPIPDQNVWFMSLPVTPNTDYHYSGWFTSVHFDNPALLDLSINGVSIEQVSLSNATCYWQNFYAVWNSGENTSIELQIVNQNTVMNGNDFAIDDISLFEACIVTDTINITLAPDPIINLGPDTIVCEGNPLILEPGGPYSQYLWQNGSQEPTLEVTQSGLYWVIVTNEFGCTGIDSIEVEVAPVPDIALGNDTTLCEGDGLLLVPGNGYTSYTWQDNSTGSTYNVTVPGTYWVTVTNDYDCAASDTIHIDFASPPDIDLGNDTSACIGDELVLSPGPGYLTYTWQDNSTGPVYMVTQPGLYWVTVTNACAEDTDTIHISFYPSPEPDIGNDTILCNGQSLTLEPGSSFASYLWQDGSALPFLVVNTTGFYSVEVSNAFGCYQSDEVFIDFANPQIELGDSIIDCLGDTLWLDAGPGFETYLWQDGWDNREYPVTVTGTYQVSVSDTNNCPASDAVWIDFVQPPVFDLGGNQSICEGDTLILFAPPGNYTYYWNGIPGTDQYSVTQEGPCALTLVNACDSVTDEIYIAEVSIPEVDLGEDQVADAGAIIMLDAGPGYDDYLWQDGFNGQILEVTENSPHSEDGLFYVEVTLGPCKSSDSILIEFFNIWAPMVITPNGDGRNDLFLPDPERWQGIQEHHIMVFNRWGEQVWESSDFESGWDGRQNGKVVSDGTYYWILEAFYGNPEIKKILKGSLTVIGSAD